MIGINYAGAIFLYLLLWLLALAWLWRRENLRIKRNEWHVTNSHLFHCKQCHHLFVPKEPVNICRCPRCNTVCIRKRSDLE